MGSPTRLRVLLFLPFEAGEFLDLAKMGASSDFVEEPFSQKKNIPAMFNFTLRQPTSDGVRMSSPKAHARSPKTRIWG